MARIPGRGAADICAPVAAHCGGSGRGLVLPYLPNATSYGMSVSESRDSPTTHFLRSACAETAAHVVRTVCMLHRYPSLQGDGDRDDGDMP